MNIREAPLHFFIAEQLSGRHLPGVPSRDSNSGPPYSEPTCYQLSHAAPYNYWAQILKPNANMFANGQVGSNTTMMKG